MEEAANAPWVPLDLMDLVLAGTEARVQRRVQRRVQSTAYRYSTVRSKARRVRTETQRDEGYGKFPAGRSREDQTVTASSILFPGDTSTMAQ